MTTILIIIVAVLIIGYVIYLSARSKKHTQRSGTENIVLTAGNSWKRRWKKIGEEYRTPEKIKAELQERIEQAFTDLKSSLENYITQLVTSEEQFKKIKANCEKKLPELKANATLYKKKFVETNEVKYKTFCEKYITSIIVNEKLLVTANESLIDITERILDETTTYDLAKSALEEKRMNILTMISDPQNTVSLSTINLNDLTEEFTSKLEAGRIKSKTANIVGGAVEPATIQSSISAEEMQAAFDNVKI